MSELGEYVEELYVTHTTPGVTSCGSFAGIVFATFETQVVDSKESAVELVTSLYPSFMGYELHIALLTFGLVAFAPNHPDFKNRLDNFKSTAEGQEGYNLSIAQPGAKGIWTLTERQSKQYDDVVCVPYGPEDAGETYVRMFRKDHFKSRCDAIELSYSFHFNMLSVTIPDCLLVEFNLGKSKL